jgi:uncharacterized SAM-binding protein YcdF (DUF218 family)
MRETVRSLRIYFILVGMLALIGNLLSINSPQQSIFGAIFSMLGVLVGAAYVYAGFVLKKLLVSTPSVVEKLLLFSGGLVVVSLLVSLIYGALPAIAKSLVGLLIIWYLLRNVRRLSAEQKPVRVETEE